MGGGGEMRFFFLERMVTGQSVEVAVDCRKKTFCDFRMKKKIIN